jgi:hypothetical protein
MRTIPAVLILVAGLAPAAAQEAVTAPGTGVRYPVRIAEFSGATNKPVALTLTGTAVRKKLIFNVYAIASYVQAGTSARTPAELAAADAVKMLHLVMQREVDGPTIADSFKTAIAAGHPGKFAAEIARLTEFLQGKSAKAGEEVWLIHVPGRGLRVVLGQQGEATIDGVAFANALWDIYLGPACIDPAMRDGLVSRVK